MVARGSGVRSTTRPRGRAARLAGLAGLALVALVSLSGCSVDQAFGFGWPEHGITDRSKQMYNLWIGSVIAAAVVGVFVWGLILWCIIRYRKRGDELPPQTRYNMPIELLYSVVPFLIVSVLFYYTAIVQVAVDKEPTNPAITIDVIAFKWNWEFSYRPAKGPDGKPLSTVPVTTIGTSDYVPGPGGTNAPVDPVRRAVAGRDPLVLGTRAAVQAGRLSGQRDELLRGHHRARKARTSAGAPSCAAPTTRR